MSRNSSNPVRSALPSMVVRHADDEGQDEGGHDPEQWRYLDGEVGFEQGILRVAEGARLGGQHLGQHQQGRAEPHQPGDEGGGVGETSGQRQPLTGAAPQLPDGRGDQPDNDQRDGEAQELAEDIVEGDEDPGCPGGQERPQQDPQHDGHHNPGQDPEPEPDALLCAHP